MKCPTCGSDVADSPPVFIEELEAEVSEETGRIIRFTPFEAELLKLLRSGRTVSKNFLIQNLWMLDEPDVAWKALDVHICHIRKKLDGSSRRIETAWGIGFRLVRHAVA